MRVIGSAANTAATKSLGNLGENQMQLDEMTMTDLAAMFAMMGLIAQGRVNPAATAATAYGFAEAFITQKQQREQENEDDNT